MELNKALKKIAADIGGNVSEYDDTRSVFVVPLEHARFQTVMLAIRQFKDYEYEIIEVSSKVCPFSREIDLELLLKENTKFCHAKFSIVDDFIKVEGSAFLISTDEKYLKEILLEVAQVADDWEFKLTGKDEN